MMLFNLSVHNLVTGIKFACLGWDMNPVPTGQEHCNHYATVLLSNKLGPRLVLIPGMVYNGPGDQRFVYGYM